MRLLRPSVFSAVLAVLALTGVPGFASPQDSRVGDTRVTYSKKGTVVRAEANTGAAPVATLPSGTSVVLQEVKLPWIKVSTVGGTTATSGWLRAYETVEPSQLAKTPPSAIQIDTGAVAVSGRDVSAASRHFTPDTERRYRQGHADLERGYALVDQMERETAAVDGTESIDFLMEGDLGRRGRDYLPPPRVPAGDMTEGKSGGGIPDVLDKVGDLPGIGGLFGGKKRDVDKVKKGAKLLGAIAGLSQQMNQKFSPGQEYYLGRAVAANALARWGVDPNLERRRYVKRIGEAIVRLTERLNPSAGGFQGSYGGFHFEVLNCPEVNGVAGPGGFVLVTSGAVEACATEDEIAGLLCHELAHVRLQHGERVIRQSKAFQARLKAATTVFEAVTDIGDSRVGDQLLDLFQGAVGEMVGMAASHGYGSALEFEADAEGSAFLYDVMYDWTSLKTYLGRLSTRPDLHGGGATHAPPAQRAGYVDRVIASYGPYQPRPGTTEARAARLGVALSRRPAPPR